MIPVTLRPHVFTGGLGKRWRFCVVCAEKATHPIHRYEDAEGTGGGGMSLFHGGVAGLAPGDVVEPNMAEHRFVPGCPDCEAHMRGEAGPLSGDPATPPEFVYACEDRQYARYYASRVGLGWLYRVELIDPEPSTEDPPQFGSWRARRGRVVSVLERAVRLSMRERRRLFMRWGGTEREWQSLLASLTPTRQLSSGPAAPACDGGGRQGQTKGQSTWATRPAGWIRSNQRSGYGSSLT